MPRCRSAPPHLVEGTAIASGTPRVTHVFLGLLRADQPFAVLSRNAAKTEVSGDGKGSRLYVRFTSPSSLAQLESERFVAGCGHFKVDPLPGTGSGSTRDSMRASSTWRTARCVSSPSVVGGTAEPGKKPQRGERSAAHSGRGDGFRRRVGVPLNGNGATCLPVRPTCIKDVAGSCLRA
jgi:hypothetical protein